MEVRRGEPLRNVFIEFFFCIIGVFIGIGLLNFILVFILIFCGVLTPENYSEREITKQYEYFQNSREIDESRIPMMTEYVQFDENLKVIRTSMDESEVSQAKKHVLGDLKGGRGGFYYNIKRDDGILTFKYLYKTYYRSRVLNEHMPDPEVLVLGLIILECIIGLIILTVIFAQRVERYMKPLIDASEKIKNGELDFTMEISKIEEINKVVCSIDKMKVGLKESLQAQWDMEDKRREEIGALAHDIKTPLTIVKGNAELLQEIEIDDEQKEYIRFLLKGTEDIQKYIDMLIQASRCESEDREISGELKEISVLELVNKIREDAAGICKGKVDVSLGEGMEKAIILGDQERILRALNNVILNAVQHTHDGEEDKEREVGLNIFCRENNCVIEIADGGNGFTQEALKRGKDMLYRGETSRGRGENHGMGLYIADRIIEEHGGVLELRNRDGCGLVIIKLPFSSLK